MLCLVLRAIWQWIETQVPHSLPEFRHVLGSWRPDFLVGDVVQGGPYPSGEIFCLTEINARFSFNGFMHEAYGRQALVNLGVEKRGLRSETNSSKILDGLCSLFRLDRPLHLLKGEEAGIDIHMFVDFLERRSGLRPRIIAPKDLRLVPDDGALQGYKLCCLAPSSSSPPSASTRLLSFGGETLEEIHQVGLELHQRELFALPRDVLRAVALRCFNDLRTVLLVHDKRMLGLVRDELDSLVARSVLSETQADALRHGIAETLLPGSPAIRELLRRCAESPDLRREYLLKPIRGGKGAGIIFGDELSASEWMAHLQQLENAAQLVPGRPTWIAQRLVKQRSYDVVFGSPAKSARQPLVGTYHVVHGELLGFGTWRAGPGRICAVSNGAAWICSVVQEDASDSESSSEWPTNLLPLLPNLAKLVSFSFFFFFFLFWVNSPV
ncbi:uncharacterized protein P884DRAFT_196060 [Thermothelomyces heterothallicus CBS 202.75]|uniref:uncharacterized protein n=1 Tax=Thermothelomyces heterothallicus CBS 202.75 TaxID=1149848 RepID=UPI003742ECD3